MNRGTKRKNTDYVKKTCNFILHRDDSCSYNGRYFHYVDELIDFLQKRADNLQDIVNGMRKLVDGKGNIIKNPQHFINTVLKKLDEQSAIVNDPNGPFAKGLAGTKQNVIDVLSNKLFNREETICRKEKRNKDQQVILEEKSMVIYGLQAKIDRRNERIENQKVIIDGNDLLIKTLKGVIEGLRRDLDALNDNLEYGEYYEPRNKMSKTDLIHSDQTELTCDEIVNIQELEMQLEAQKRAIESYQSELKKGKEKITERYEEKLEKSININKSLNIQIKKLKEKFRASNVTNKMLEGKVRELKQKLNESRQLAIKRIDELHTENEKLDNENEKLNEDLQGAEHNVGVCSRKAFGVGRERGKKITEQTVVEKPVPIPIPIDRTLVHVVEKAVPIPIDRTVVHVVEKAVPIPIDRTVVHVFEKAVPIPIDRTVVHVFEKPIPVHMSDCRPAPVSTFLQNPAAVHAFLDSMSIKCRNQFLREHFSKEELDNAKLGGEIINGTTFYDYV